MEAAPASSLVMPEPDLAFQVLIVALILQRSLAMSTSASSGVSSAGQGCLVLNTTPLFRGTD